jgi:hypothetical protein
MWERRGAGCTRRQSFNSGTIGHANAEKKGRNMRLSIVVQGMFATVSDAARLGAAPMMKADFSRTSF